ncbi:hypothetical protein BDQ12DRAFT_640731 [Crucibulum laeve]|uniref:Uncharacterized protein n=1 Tax=Crucibulum laeve TaxID=68775 RepID=A0A5C3MFS6_9AGAR|nr:hypothetical protein BDQ12DRAFT_640731 [Crucibulum laeve]
MAIVDTAPPILSFPAILRNPGLNNRFAHLHGGPTVYKQQQQINSQASVKRRHRDQNEGKRWIRRKDNARFVGNPHIVAATKRDYALNTPYTRQTFPEPLPAYLPRSAKLPVLTVPPATDPASANAGRFSLSLKGMRRDLRRAGGRAEYLVREVEDEMVDWLRRGGAVLAPDALGAAPVDTNVSGTPVGNTGTIFEVSRTPLQLVWRIADDPFARYVVHCCARYHEIVSFSKGDLDKRLTYLLRPNVTRPDHHAPATLNTPPVTDIDYSSHPESDIDSDFISDRELERGIDSDAEGPPLSAIAESLPASPFSDSVPLGEENEDAWSMVEGDSDADIEADESGSELGIEPAVAGLSLTEKQPLPLSGSPLKGVEDQDGDRTLGPDDVILSLSTATPLTSTNHRVRGVARSASSPSRSPARTRASRRRAGKRLAGRGVVVGIGGRGSFYEYLFL